LLRATTNLEEGIHVYGTIYRFQIKPGKEAELKRFFEMEGSEEDKRLKAAGLVSAQLFKLDKGGYMGVAVFENKEKYVANANDPEQDRWYRQFRELLEADPEWNDGEVVLDMS
jgi:hypothetical protein